MPRPSPHISSGWANSLQVASQATSSPVAARRACPRRRQKPPPLPPRTPDARGAPSRASIAPIVNSATGVADAASIATTASTGPGSRTENPLASPPRTIAYGIGLPATRRAWAANSRHRLPPSARRP